MKRLPLLLILLCITGTISLLAGSKISPPKKLIKQHHYYGVEANTGALIWLESSTNLYWTPSAFMSNTFTVIYRLQSKLDTVQRVWKAPLQVSQPSPPMPPPIPPMPPMFSALRAKMNGAGGGTSQTWSTDPNLQLSIVLTNCLTPIPWPATNWIPSYGASNLTLSVICGLAVVISFQTQTGKLYQCQATDDAKKTWTGGTPVVGTGQRYVQYEAAIKTNRMYRVFETTL